MNPQTFTRNEGTKIYKAPDGSTWQAIVKGKTTITAYIEVFYDKADDMFVSIPDVSRFIKVEA